MEATKKNKQGSKTQIAVFGKDICILLNLMDDNIEWLIVPTGDNKN